MQPLHHGSSVKVFWEHPIDGQFHNLEKKYTGIFLNEVRNAARPGVQDS